MSVLRIICTLRCCALKSGRPVQSSVCAMAARSDFQQGVLLMCVIARLSCFHILPHILDSGRKLASSQDEVARTLSCRLLNCQWGWRIERVNTFSPTSPCEVGVCCWLFGDS